VRFGVSTQLYHGQRLCRHHLDEIAACGFDTVELIATRTHLDYHDPRALDELARWLNETGLRLHAIHAPVTESVEHGRWGSPLTNASSQARVREHAVAETRAALELARRVPVRVLVVHMGLPDGLLQAPGENSRDAARRSLQEIASMTDPLGVQIALENIPNAISTPDAIVAMIEDELELSGVGACLDVGHAHLMGGVVDAVETLSGLLLTTHVHDNLGQRDEHLPPGEGTIAWASVMMALQKVGYEGLMVMEVAASGSPTRTILERTRAACTRLDDEVRSWS
jgi:sugar phosphate isomerase/epimerase